MCGFGGAFEGNRDVLKQLAAKGAVRSGSFGGVGAGTDEALRLFIGARLHRNRDYVTVAAE